MLNFNLPFFASNINELWRRWHISLSTWLRDYLYRPLGGSLHSKARTTFNVFLVMFLCGLWHGAGWNYAAWGVYLGIGMVIYNAFIKPFTIGESRGHDWRWFLGVFVTYHFFISAAVFFRSSRQIFDGTRFVDDSANQLMEMLTAYRNGFGLNPDTATILFNMSLFIVPMIIIQIFQYVRDDHLFFLKIGVEKRVLFFSFLIFYWLYFGIQGGDQFIYFQF
jgi:D-alanyl-lipoteichoic acid acyltransferase DltB (MBOAT superfamily)